MAEINTVIAEASQDLQTIEDFVNLPADSDVRPRLLPSVNVGTLAGTRQAIFEAGGLPATPFATKSLMTASALVDGKYAQVTDDTVNNGLYVKAAGAWVKSAYDPVSQAGINAGVAQDLLELRHTHKGNILSVEQVTFQKMPTNTTGIVSVVNRSGINQLKVSSAATGGSIIASWDIPASYFTGEFSISVDIEGLTSGSNGVVGVQCMDSNSIPIASQFAATYIVEAYSAKNFKVTSPKPAAEAVFVRLLVSMQTASTREMYISNPYIANGSNSKFLAPLLTEADRLFGTAFDIVAANKNAFKPSGATNGHIIAYNTGALGAYADGVALGKLAVLPNTTYTLSLADVSNFSLKKIIYCYSEDTYLGMDVSVGAGTEVLYPEPPVNVVYKDDSKTVTFTIPNGSAIRYIQMMTEYRTHTTLDFNTLVNGVQFERGSNKTHFEPYSHLKKERLVLKEEALPSNSSNEPVIDTKKTGKFTVTLDGVSAYIRTNFDAANDMVQKVEYGTTYKWLNNVVNATQVKTIPKETARNQTVAAFSTGVVLATQGDDAAPLKYNDTYIGANHGANIVHSVTVDGHNKTFKDVGSQWTQGINTYTIVRIVDANKLWLISQNIGTDYWAYITTSLVGLTLTHKVGATNTTTITPTADTLTQLYPAINNHSKIITAENKIISGSGIYDVDSLEITDSYDIMNIPAVMAYLQSKVGSSTEVFIDSDSIASDVRTSTAYSFNSNGSVTISNQVHTKSAIKLDYIGVTQANPINSSGKSLLLYAPKMADIVVSGKNYNLTGTVDATSPIAALYMTKDNWLDASNPPDRMAQIVKSTSNEFGHVVGYSLARGDSKTDVRSAIDDAGFYYGATKKMYPKAVTGHVYPLGIVPSNTVFNFIAYRSLFSSAALPEATVYTWYKDNNDVYVIFDAHQSVTMLKLPLPLEFSGKSAVVIDSSVSATLHSDVVSDGGLLVSVTGGYGQAIIKIN